MKFAFFLEETEYKCSLIEKDSVKPDPQIIEPGKNTWYLSNLTNEGTYHIFNNKKSQFGQSHGPQHIN